MGHHHIAIVTGAGKRLGQQIAIELGRNGYTVVVNYNTSKTGAQKTIDIIRKSGSQAISIQADVSKRVEVKKMINKILSAYGRIDLLVNNASVFIDGMYNQITERSWEQTIGVNLTGTFLCSQMVAPVMLEQKKGNIINIASLGGIQSWSKHIPYSVSKAGVIMLTKCMAKALAPYVCVNAIAPGTVLMQGGRKESISQLNRSKIPLRRFAVSNDINEVVLFLANNSKYITGQVISVDGGVSIP